jgi:hypothetical protein
MGRRHLGLAIVLGISMLGSAQRAQAQFGGTGDPFSLYYGYYLPHQAAVAAQATPLDTINAAQAARQFSAAADRSGLYDPVSPYGSEEDYDPTRPYARTRTAERLMHPHTFATSTTNARMRGFTPPMYYSRTARYYPTRRIGVGPNMNLTVSRNGRSGGMSSMPAPPQPAPMSR